MGLIPHVVPGTWPAVSSTRLASSMVRPSLDGFEIGLLGMPDDLGVSMNNGRTGAADGPTAFRQALSRYGALHVSGLDWPTIADIGDIVPGASLTETHDRVTQAVSELLHRGIFPIGIGGGHDLTFPFVRAVTQRFPSMVGVYLDAHLDVRDEEGSGMPFRRLIEQCGVRELHVHGLDPYSNTDEHKRWFEGHGGRVDQFSPLDPWPQGDLFVSVDLDVLDQAFAPGVSAPNPCGWSPAEADAWARAAGACSRVRCFDLMELNPKYDEDDRTARLAVRLFLSFLRGFVERGS